MLATTPVPAFDTDATFLIIAIISRLVFAIVCAALAPGRGRSPVGWFFLGLAIDCLALILVLLLPNLKLEEDRRRRREGETRKLREQLKKERQVADERHLAHDQRIGAHDRALGLDTSGPTTALPPGSAQAPALPPTGAPEWFYAVDGKQKGPVTASELRTLWLDEHIPDTTLVWRDGMSDWMSIGKVADLLGDDRG